MQIERLNAEVENLFGLTERAREVFRHVVDTYLETGEPVGSRVLSRRLSVSLSPASIRNVMQDLEELGLIYAPHVSAGRLPTELGLRFFVDAVLELGDLSHEERDHISHHVRAASQDHPLAEALAESLQLLSGLARVAGVVVTSKDSFLLKQIEFVRLEPERALVVLVSDRHHVENRLITIPADLPSYALVEAGNYLNARLRGRTLQQVSQNLDLERKAAQVELDELTTRLVEAGLASWAELAGDRQQLIVRGQANLLEDLSALEELERVRLLFADLETKKDVIDLLTRAETGEGVRIFIGSENKLFSLSGSSMIAAPLKDAHNSIVGVLGVIGPTRLNYGRIIPMVAYAAKVVGETMGEI